MCVGAADHFNGETHHTCTLGVTTYPRRRSRMARIVVALPLETRGGWNGILGMPRSTPNKPWECIAICNTPLLI